MVGFQDTKLSIINHGHDNASIPMVLTVVVNGQARGVDLEF
jgi:hypothetical protein